MNKLKISKFCNNLVDSGPQQQQNVYVDLNNHVFRLNYLLENIDIRRKTEELALNRNETQEVETFFKGFFHEIKNNCGINKYLNEKKRQLEQKKAKKSSEKKNNNVNEKDIECIDIEDTEVVKPAANVTSNEETSVSMNESTTVTLNEELIEKSKANVDLLMKLFQKNELDEQQLVQEKFNEIINEKNLEFIKHFCVLLSNSLAESDRFESKMSLLTTCLRNLNTNSSILTYTKLTIVLKNLFCNYLISINLNKSTKQIETFTLSKKMLQMCSDLFCLFPNQFTEACFIEWVKLLIIESSAKNSKNIEFLLKLFKDLFSETEALLVLNFIVRQHLNDAWNEEHYVFLNNIFDKILKPNQSDMQLLVNKMKCDCKAFSKSLPFAKFLSNVINKVKNIHNHDQELPSNETTKTDAYFESVKQDIAFIVEHNQTLMKKKLIAILD